MKLSPKFVISLALLVSTPALAADTLPIKTGSYSFESCGKSSNASRRSFSPGKTETGNDSCKLEITSSNGKTYNARMLCTFNDGGKNTENVTFIVHSQTSVTMKNSEGWSADYSYCGGKR
ncbi:hypothetical protein [Bradyrhizobium elkanii]|uniref:hypothetical protein n=1 Tax=Bradyrhizobium elkanii TaxID=29448 RepID=UPI00351609D9